MVREIHFGLIGVGNIGFSTLKYIDEKNADLKRKKNIALVPGKVYDIRGDEVYNQLGHLKNISTKIANSAEEVIDDPESEIILEATGKDVEARDLAYEIFRRGKSLVTPNKLIIAKYTNDLFSAARDNGQDIGFEASVMGGVPVTEIARKNTAGVKSYLAILNGTSNLVLTEMLKRGADGALEYAKEIGAAEPDPSFDITGKDTQHKNKILNFLFHGVDIGYDKIMVPAYVDGIQNVTDMDIRYAREFGYVIKLLGKSKIHGNGKIEFGTYPFLLETNHDLASVDKTVNALYVDFEDKGPQTFKGMGAGPLPTRAAVLEDIIETDRRRRGKEVDIPYLGEELETIEPFELSYPFYIRFTAIDRPGVLGKLSYVLGDNDVSIASVVQKRQEGGGNDAIPIYMLTHEANVGKVFRAINYIDDSLMGKAVRDKSVVIRVETDDI